MVRRAVYPAPSISRVSRNDMRDLVPSSCFIFLSPVSVFAFKLIFRKRAVSRVDSHN